MFLKEQNVPVKILLHLGENLWKKVKLKRTGIRREWGADKTLYVCFSTGSAHL